MTNPLTNSKKLDFFNLIDDLNVKDLMFLKTNINFEIDSRKLIKERDSKQKVNDYMKGC